ncbi:hypothetical protein D3C71_1469410 [compost metagenome]
MIKQLQACRIDLYVIGADQRGVDFGLVPAFSHEPDANAVFRHAPLRNHGKVVAPGFQVKVAEDQPLMLQHGFPGREQSVFEAAAVHDVERLRRFETRIHLRHVYRLK